MAHRGRLTVLANVIEQGHRAGVLPEFEGELSEEDFEGSGDDKYHLVRPAAGGSSRAAMPFAFRWLRTRVIWKR